MKRLMCVLFISLLFINFYSVNVSAKTDNINTDTLLNLLKNPLKAIWDAIYSLQSKVKILSDTDVSLQKQIKNISFTPGPQGPQGIQGEQGTAGINGTNGTNGLDANMTYINQTFVPYQNANHDVNLSVYSVYANLFYGYGMLTNPSYYSGITWDDEGYLHLWSNDLDALDFVPNENAWVFNGNNLYGVKDINLNGILKVYSSQGIVPMSDGFSDIGTDNNRFSHVYSNNFFGDIANVYELDANEVHSSNFYTDGSYGVSVSGSSCIITEIKNGIVTGAACT